MILDENMSHIVCVYSLERKLKEQHCVINETLQLDVSIYMIFKTFISIYRVILRHGCGINLLI